MSEMGNRWAKHGQNRSYFKAQYKLLFQILTRYVEVVTFKTASTSTSNVYEKCGRELQHQQNISTLTIR